MSLSFKKKDELPFLMDPRRVFDQLHRVPAIDFVLESTKNYFARNYNIDYFSIHMFNSKHDFLIGRYNHDNWHEYLQKKGLSVHLSYIDIYKLPNMKKETSYFEELEIILDYEKSISVRAEIIGTRKRGGFNLVLSNEVNDKTIYDVTFKDDTFINSLKKSTATKLLSDMKKCENVLKSLLYHGSTYGDFDDKIVVDKLMDQWRKEFAFLL